MQPFSQIANHFSFFTKLLRAHTANKTYAHCRDLRLSHQNFTTHTITMRRVLQLLRKLKLNTTAVAAFGLCLHVLQYIVPTIDHVSGTSAGFLPWGGVARHDDNIRNTIAIKIVTARDATA